MNARISCRVLALLPLLVGLGCSGGGKPVKVEGVATLDGKPLPAAMIQFIPDGGGVPANGVTGTDGTFRLTTYSSSDGAMPGTYKVLVSLAASDQGESDVKDPRGGEDPSKMMGAMKDYQDKSRKAGPKKPNLPITYSDPTKTTLKQVVPPPEGKVTLDLRSSGS